jgi:para-nitrobenzyl esterase
MGLPGIGGELPGIGGELRAVHTGDMPFLWANYTNQVLAR